MNYSLSLQAKRRFDMKFAFLIAAHNDPVQLKRLIECLPRQAVFIVHIDAKSDLQAFTSIISDSRVYFIEDRTDVMWGSIGVVEAQMKMIRQALEIHRQSPIDYLMMLSGLEAITKHQAVFQIGFNTAIVAALLLTVLGALAGLAPALRAMSIKPVEAMHDE